MSPNPERRAKILIVDDSKTIVALIKSILKEDYDTVTASNGFEAIEVNNRTKPDLILMDVEMPVMDGFEACKKKSKNKAKIPSSLSSSSPAKGICKDGKSFYRLTAN